MPLRRRTGLRVLAALAGARALAPAAQPAAAPPADDPADTPVGAARRLQFPRDYGAHPARRIEWWYATGWLQADAGAPLLGWQLTFFRLRTGLAGSGRLAPRQLLFAHAALSDVATGRHLQAQRVARWSGDDLAPHPRARRGDTDVALGAWWLRRGDGAGSPAAPPQAPYRARLAAPEAGFTLELELQPTQPVLLQGDAGVSRKGPQSAHASHYYTQPQLRAHAQVALDAAGLGRPASLHGRGWLDHEWSDAPLPPGAVGWDWIGINLDDGGALTAFVLRQADGQPLWGGGSLRTPDARLRVFAPHEVRFQALRLWRSPATGAQYPVQWRIELPSGRYELQALMDDQELDSRASVGAVYWEGLVQLRPADGAGRRLGLGYLEMTGRFSPLRLG